MSKSLGNVVSPDEMVERYGGDSTRMYTLFATSPDRELDWQDEGVAGIYRFLGKVYRYVEANAHPQDPQWHAPVPEGLGDSARRLQRKLHQTIKRVSDDFQGRWHFNTCIAAIMELVNDANRRTVGAIATHPVTEAAVPPAPSRLSTHSPVVEVHRGYSAAENGRTVSFADRSRS